MEFRVYGSNSLWGAVGGQAVVTDIYLDGWRSHNPAEDLNGNGWCSDDIAVVLQLDGSYQYIKVTAWGPEGLLNEPEVDAIATFISDEIPEFATIALPALSILGLFLYFNHRKRRKE